MTINILYGIVYIVQGKESKAMNGREIILAIMEEKRIGYTQLGKVVGKSPVAVRNRLIRQDEGAKDLSANTLKQYAEALGYEVVIREKGKKRGKEYVIE